MGAAAPGRAGAAAAGLPDGARRAIARRAFARRAGNLGVGTPADAPEPQCWTAATANAAILDKFSYTDSESGTFEDCGTTWSFDFQASGFVILRLDDDGDTGLAQDNGSFTDTLTNLETGRFVSISGHSLFREVEAVRVGDIITVDARQSGVPVVIADDSGDVILRDRGLIEFRQTFQVADHDIIFLDEQVIGDHGGHPTYYADFCSVMLPATS